MKVFSKYKIEYFLLFIIVIFSIARIYQFNLPKDVVFDEVYFPVMAQEFITKGSFYDVHPPLGKLIIALSESIFGNNTMGWRSMSVLAGLLFLGVIYIFVKELFKNRLIALVATALFAIDGLFIVYSRLGLIDIFMALFGFSALYFCVKYQNSKKILDLFLAGLFLGFVLSVKWIGLGFVFLCILYTVFTNPKKFKNKMYWVKVFSALILIPFIVYIVWFIPLFGKNLFIETINWHKTVWRYHFNLSASHVYGSKWWSWPLMIRPIWFYYEENHNIVKGIIALANPLLIWFSTFSLLSTFIWIIWLGAKRYKMPIIASIWFIIVGWFVFYFPWVGVTRVVFFYHYMIAYAFALIILSYILVVLKENYFWVFWIIFSGLIIVSLIYLPLWIGYPISQGYYKHLMLFNTWI